MIAFTLFNIAKEGYELMYMKQDTIRKRIVLLFLLLNNSSEAVYSVDQVIVNYYIITKATLLSLSYNHDC